MNWFLLMKPKDSSTGVLPGTLRDGLKLIRFILLWTSNSCQTWKEVGKTEDHSQGFTGPEATMPPAPPLNKVSSNMSCSISSLPSLSRQPNVQLSPALGSRGLVWGWISLISIVQLWVSLWTLLHACSPNMSYSSPSKTVFSLSQLTLPNFLTDLMIISFFFFSHHGIAVRAHLERLSQMTLKSFLKTLLSNTELAFV